MGYLGIGSRGVSPLTIVKTPNDMTNDLFKERFSIEEGPFSAEALDDNSEQTTVIGHAPGWTMFSNLYMSNGTFFIVTSQDEANASQNSSMPWRNGTIPIKRFIISTGLPGFDNPQSYQEREPTDHDLRIITNEDANSRWGDRLTVADGHSVRDIEDLAPHAEVS